MNILIVGAGAVGQVYARHLTLAGAKVSLFVRPKYADECRRPLPMYPLNRRNPRAKAVDFSAHQVLTSNQEVAATTWDQVYLCVSTTAIRGEWLAPFLAAIGSATLIALQPGLDDREHILKNGPSGLETRLVSGMISLISYHAPLPGEVVPTPGMAYWFPPLSPSPFSGPGDKVNAVVRALNAGGLPAKVHSDVPRLAAYPSALLMLLVAALEACGWSFRGLAHSPTLACACAANQEALVVIHRKISVAPPLAMLLVRPWLLRIILRIAPWFVPLDLETYFSKHFTKVGDQTRFLVGGYIESGHELKIATRDLEALLGKLK